MENKELLIKCKCGAEKAGIIKLGGVICTRCRIVLIPAGTEEYSNYVRLFRKLTNEKIIY